LTKDFKLPGSGFDVITKVLHAYAVCGQNASLQEVAKKSGLDPTMVSRNNGFLLSIKAIEGGNKKSLTHVGKLLAMAIGNSLEDEAKSHWAKLFLDCNETSSALEMIKIQRGIPKDQFAGRLASTFGVVANGTNKTGLNSIADILAHAHLIEEIDGKYVVNNLHRDPINSTTTELPNTSTNGEVNATQAHVEDHSTKSSKTNGSQFPDVHINIQVHISPESTPEQIEKIFESMAKYMRPGNDD
jgi:hypothetical protein